EDNTVNQKVAVRILEKLGCRVDAVANGREAVEALAQIAYDFVFMDCQMPEMDGYDATAAIRTREVATGTHIPIIALTANVMQGSRERCQQAGMDDYVSKPVKSESLLEMLRKWAPSAAGSAPPSDAAASETSTLAKQGLQSALDAETFHALKELCDDGDPTFLLSLIEPFIQDTVAHIDALHAAIDTSNAAALERTAHTLKSSSGYIGALGMAELCRTLQTLGHAGSIPEAVPLVNQLAAEFERVRRALCRECATMRASSAEW
ncbi:MAG: response regulator, partial [Candidatus Tectomicrobia bacterium]